MPDSEPALTGSTPSGPGAEAGDFDTLAFRQTLGYLAAGVTVVSVYVDGEPYGMTANAVTSVSLTPPLVLVCVDRRAHLASRLREAVPFGINILSEAQEPLSRFFARSWQLPVPPAHRFQEWAGMPQLAGSLAAVSCRVSEVLPGGDHIIVLGRVVGVRVDQPNGRPLLYYRGTYASLVDWPDHRPEAPELGTARQFQLYYPEWEPEDADERRRDWPYILP